MKRGNTLNLPISLFSYGKWKHCWYLFAFFWELNISTWEVLWHGVHWSNDSCYNNYTKFWGGLFLLCVLSAYYCLWYFVVCFLCFCGLWLFPSEQSQAVLCWWTRSSALPESVPPSTEHSFVVHFSGATSPGKYIAAFLGKTLAWIYILKPAVIVLMIFTSHCIFPSKA